MCSLPMIEEQLGLLTQHRLVRQWGGGRPIWVPEAASILTSTAPIHGKVERWLVDTGCGYDLVARSHIESMKKWVRKAVKSKSFQTASGKTTADQVARMTVSEFGEEIAPYMLDSTPAVLSVGYRCMNLGYPFIWPKGENPYFLLPKGQVSPLVSKGDVPYLYPGNLACKPSKPKKKKCFACLSALSLPAALGEADSGLPDGWASMVPEDGASSSGGGRLDIEEIQDEGEAEKVLPEGMRNFLKEEASSLHHQLIHRPKNPYCDTCRRATMRLVRKLTGSFKKGC